MSRAMYSAISGMRVNQTKLDVVSNNIANSSTTAYKSARARFSDMLSQNSSSATAPTNNAGGTNASQVGLGVQLASIDTIFTYGALQTTGRGLDVAIDQGGFFIVSQGPVINEDNAIGVSQSAGTHAINSNSLSTSGSNIMYTRDGAFILDRDGNLLTGSGLRVMGYSLTNDDNNEQPTAGKPQEIGLDGLTYKFGPGSQLNDYKIVYGSVGPGTPTSATVDTSSKEIVLNANLTSSDLSAYEIQNAINNALGSKSISQEVIVSGTLTCSTQLVKTEGTGNDKKTTNLLEIQMPTDAGQRDVEVNGVQTKQDNPMIDSDSDLLGLQFTLPSTLTGYTIRIGTIKEGTEASVELSTNAKTITINGDFVNDKTENRITADKIEQELNQQLSIKGFATSNMSDGNLVKVTGTVGDIPGITSASQKISGGTSVQSISPDGNIYFVDGTGTVSSYDQSLKSLKIPDKVKMAGTGELVKVTSYTISEDGLVMGNLENGKQAALGQIALANFKNPEGLEKKGNNLYTVSANSGDAIIKSGVNTTGEDNSKGYGSTVQGFLEASNVDLAEQFTDMIIATRAFQANSKAINTGDEILQEIINLKR